MIELEALCRGAVIGVTLFVAAAGWSVRPGSAVAWVWLLFSFGVCGRVLAPDFVYLSWPPVSRLGISIFALSAPFFFWLFVQLIFDDEFRVRPIQFAWLAIIEAAGAGMFVLRGREPSWIAPTLNAGFRLISLALVAHALWMVWKGRSTDLVEARGRLRIVLVVCVGLITAAVLLTAYLFGPVADRPISVKLGEAVALLLFALTAGVRLLRFAPEYPRLPDEAATPRPQLPAFIESMAAAPGDFPAEEAASLALLETLMSEGEVWRETGLTIGSLARRVGVPEYRLRRLINQRLGFRNFTSFLNDYRLAAAAERLADGSRVRTPILTIALDLGWGSIGPFNRAFRSRFGISPSDYRRDRTQRPRPPDRAPPPADS